MAGFLARLIPNARNGEAVGTAKAGENSMAVPLGRMMTSGNRKKVAEEEEERSAAEREQANIAIYNNFEERLEASRKADEEFCKKIADELRHKIKL